MPLSIAPKIWLAAVFCLTAINPATAAVAAQQTLNAVPLSAVLPKTMTSRQDPTQKEFANLVIEALGQVSDVKFVYDADNFRLVGQTKDKSEINLSNVYREYLAQDASDRPAHLARVAAAFSSRDTDLPVDFDSAKFNLMPKIWSRATFENLKLKQRINGGEIPDIPLHPLGDHLFTSIVFDTKDAMRSISSKNLDQWGVTYDEAFEIACENLEATTEAYSRIGDHFHSSVSGDNYDSARVMLDHVRSFDVKGDTVALVANRDLLHVAGSDDPESLKMMFDLAPMEADARPLNPLPMIWQNDEWTDWLPPEDHEARATFDERSLQFFGTLYGEQKQLLHNVLVHEGKDIFVASFSAMKNPETEVTRSYCVWSNGVDSLLPKTQLVIICAEQGEMTAVGEWDHVRKVVGDLIEVDDTVYPTRYRVKEFPSAEQLEAIGKIDF